MYIMALVLRPRVRTLSPLGLLALLVATSSLMVFGGRTALVMVLLVLAGVAASHLVRLARGERVRLPAVILAICCIMLVGIAVPIAFGTGVFDNMIARFSSDNGSAHARISTFRLLGLFDWKELMLGNSPERASSLQSMMGLDYGIENFWIACIVQYGIIQTALITLGLSVFFAELLRRSAKGARIAIFFVCLVAASSVSFSSKNTTLAAYVAVIVLMLPRESAAQEVLIRSHRRNRPQLIHPSSRHDKGNSRCASMSITAIFVRPITGLERITQQLFSVEALAPLDAVPVRASRMSDMLLTQSFGLAGCLMRSPSSLLLCPGFPPTPLLHAFGGRVIPYIHDVFLLSRRADLNWRAKAYMAWPFDLAVRRLPRPGNSFDTATKLAAYCRPDADIIFYRPAARNNFRLDVGGRMAWPDSVTALRLVALGTVEPRKNLVAAGRIVGALRQRGNAGATLEVIGRRGWGDDWASLSAMPGVVLHGYQPDREVTAILTRADALISTSHEEGLGLPLLEAQYAGLPIIAPDQPVFREVLDRSGIFVGPGDRTRPQRRSRVCFARGLARGLR